MQELYGAGRVRQKLGYLAAFEYYLPAPRWKRQ